jgi:hypothetical protein
MTGRTERTKGTKEGMRMDYGAVKRRERRAPFFWLVCASLLLGASDLRGQSFPLGAGVNLASTTWVTNFVRDLSMGGDMGSRGALMFSGGKVTSTMLEQNVGSADFSLWARVYVPRSTSGTPGIVEVTSSGTPSAATYSFRSYLNSADLVFALRGTATGNARVGTVSSFATTYAGRVVDLVFVRFGSTPSVTLYVNGVSTSYTETTLGTPPTWAGDVVGPYLHFGTSSDGAWMDRIGAGGIFNYAVSAQEAWDLSTHLVMPATRTARMRGKIKGQNLNGEIAGGSSVNWSTINTGTVTYDGVNFELDVTSTSNGDGAQLLNTYFSGVRLSTLHRLEFEVRNSSGATVSAAWGAQSIGSGVGNGKWWLEWTPNTTSGDLKFTSTAGTSWSITGIRMTEVGNVDGASAEFANGGFDTAGGGGADVFGTWTETTSGSTAWTRETSAVYSGTGAAKLVVDGSNNTGSLEQAGVLTVGRRYRVKLWAKVDATTGSPTASVYSGSTAAFTVSLSTSYAQTSGDFTATSTTLGVKNLSAPSRTLYFDNVELLDLGAAADLDFAAGVGYQAQDRTQSRAHAVIGSTGVEHAVAKRRGEIRGRTSTSGNQQLLGATCIPTNARIAAINITSDGSVTVNIGNASGGSQIASGVSVVSGKNEVGTFASRYSSTGAVWVNSTGTANLDFCVWYDVVD